MSPHLDETPRQRSAIAANTVDMPESFNAVFMARPDGTLAFSTAVPEGVKMTVGERDYFRAISQGASFAVSDLLQGKHSAAPGSSWPCRCAMRTASCVPWWAAC